MRIAFILMCLCVSSYAQVAVVGEESVHSTGGAGDFLTNIAHRWDFETDFSDSIGTFDFTPVGNAHVTNGWVRFDGLNDGLTCNETTVVGRTEWTFTAWIKPVGESQDHDIWTAVDHAAGDSLLWIDEAGTDTLSFLITESVGGSDTTGGQSGSIAIVRDSNTWTHISFVMDAAGDSFQTYVDGVLDIDITDTTVAEVGDFGTLWYIAEPQDGTALKEYNGDMDDLRVYSAALTGPQINQIYDATTH